MFYASLGNIILLQFKRTVNKILLVQEIPCAASVCVYLQSEMHPEICFSRETGAAWYHLRYHAARYGCI